MDWVVFDVEDLWVVAGPGAFAVGTHEGWVPHTRQCRIVSQILVFELQIQKVVFGVQCLTDLDRLLSFAGIVLCESAMFAVLHQARILRTKEKKIIAHFTEVHFLSLHQESYINTNQIFVFKGSLETVCIESMQTLYMYVIHTQALKLRAMHIHGVIQNIRTIALACGYDVHVRLIMSPDPHELQGQLEELQKIVNYDPVNHEIYDGLRQILSTEIISNMKKHHDAWKRIAEHADDTNDLHLVLEDDVFMIPQSTDHLSKLFKVLRASKESWDFVFPGISANDDSSVDQQLKPLRELAEVLPCKESYFVRPSIAKRCLSEWTVLRYTLRFQLSYWFYKNPWVKTMYVSKRVFLDGSKLGVMPSAVHPNNILVMNKEFMDLYKFWRMEKDDIKKNWGMIQKIYDSVTSMNSPDMMQIFGQILLKTGKLRDAKKLFLQAISNLETHNCPVRSQSELYQSLISLHEHMQDDLQEITRKPSKYEDPAMAKPEIILSAS